jgi:GTP cyclohydrolase II
VFYERPVREGHPRMSAVHSSANSALFGNKECIRVSRALSELQARRPIRISASGESLLALPVDGLDEQRLGDFAVLCSPNVPKLVITQQRARSIGIKASTAMALPISRVVGVSTIFDLAANAGNEGHFTGTAEAASRAATAAIRLAKLSRSLPAVLAANVMPNRNDDLTDLIVTVEADAVNQFAADATNAFRKRAFASSRLLASPLSSARQRLPLT